MVNFQQPMDFDYSMYSKAALRFVVDSMHLINTEELDLYVLTEVMDYLHFEGKTKLSHFERKLANNLMETLLDLDLPTSTQILLCLVISTMDNYNDAFEKKMGASLTQATDFSICYLNNMK